MECNSTVCNSIINHLVGCGFMVFNTTFNNISVISWWSVLLVEETGGPGENHRPATRQTLSHNVVHLALSGSRTHIGGDGTDCIGNSKSNYHMIMATTAPLNHLMLNNYITSVFHWNVTIWLVMKWSHDYKRDVLYPNKTQTWTCTCLHDDVRCKQSMA
jgi:hypothetical protein